MIKIIKSKLKTNKGESLSETLVAMLIVSMGMIVLAGAIVTSAKSNDAAARIKAFNSKDASGSADFTIALDGESSDTISVLITPIDESTNARKVRTVYFYE